MRGVRAYVLAVAAAAVVPFLVPAPETVSVAAFPGWPAAWEGRPLTQLPLSAKEQVFLEGFPGKVGRFSDGEREIVLRYVEQATRLLHPSADCFRATGYGLDDGRLQHGPDGTLWSYRVASGPAGQVRFREQVQDGHGGTWSDVSSWYWAALLGRTQGPWWAVTVTDP